MTAMSLKDFSGMIPRTPNHLLPDNAASFARDCDFSRTALASLKGGLEVLNVTVPVGKAIRAMYTGDGIFWYTWWSELVAYRSPVINEVYNRLYYIEGGVFKVSPSPEPSSSLPGGQVGGPPNPGLTWNVGVPTPVFTPEAALVDRNSLADYPSATIEFKTWYSDGAANFGVTTIVPTVVTPWRRYGPFTPPAPAADAPDGVILVVQATASDGPKQLFQMNTASNTIQPAVSAALPGGITMALEGVAGGAYYISFSWGVIETRAYIFTEVNTWDEESGPSAVALISPTYLQDVQIAVTHPDFTGYRPYKQTNIYRTYGGSQYIKALSGVGTPIPSTPKFLFVDAARTVQSATGTALPSLSWVPPPIGLFGLVLAPNGWFAAFKENILYMSEPYRPHTWQYSMTFAKAITGICVGSQSIVVTTKEATYIVTGPHPASVTSMTVPIPVGGISQRSMCAIEGGVAFLSNDGIVVVEGSQASLQQGQRYFTRETWRNMFGSELPNMALAYHDGFVVATSNNAALGFILELDEAAGAMTRFDYRFSCMVRLPVLDTLYYADSGNIYRFREGDPLYAEWYSKHFIATKYLKLGIGFARMSGSGQVVVLLYADEDFVHAQQLDAIDRTKYFRLPPHPGALKWRVEISLAGDCSLDDLAFAQSPDELKDV